MTDAQFAEILGLKHEISGVEFKPPGPRTNKPLFHRVARAAIGMANHRDGGRVVIGVRETAGVFDPVGLDAADVASWRHEHVADAMAALADPPVVFDVQVRKYKKRQFVLIEVQEFEDVPIICRRTFPRLLESGEKLILRKGAIYVRPRRKPETSEVEDQADLRDLLELAIEKGLQKFIGTVSRAGGTMQPQDTSRAEPPEPELAPQTVNSRAKPPEPELALHTAAEAFLSELPDDFK